MLTLNKNILLSMIQDLEDLNNLSHEKFYEESIKTRLDESFKSYEHELQNSKNYLEQRNNLSVLKKLNRMNKNGKVNK